LTSGLISGIAIFANFAFSPLPLIMGLFALIYGLGVRKVLLQTLVVLGIAYGLGAALPWMLFGLATGLTPLDLLRASFEFHLDLDRPFAFWAVMHLWDWLVWGGITLSILSVTSAWRARRDLDGGAALSLALIGGMLLITLSGTARGETGRVWLVFTPLLVVSAADGLRRLSGETRSWTAIAAVNGILALVLVLSIPVVGIDLTPPPPIDHTAAPQPADAQFVDGNGNPLMRLAGWTVVPADGGVDVWLSFVPQRRLSEPYYVGGVLVLPDGATLASHPQQPVNAAGEMTPATCWSPEQVATVRFFQPVPPGTSTAAAYVSVAVYGAASGAGPLTVLTADGRDTQIGLGPFTTSAETDGQAVAMISAAVTKTNQTFGAAGVMTQLNVGAYQPVFHLEQVNEDFHADLNNLTGASDDLDEIYALRDYYAADLMPTPDEAHEFVVSEGQGLDDGGGMAPAR
jgi:hypothetical protein